MNSTKDKIRQLISAALTPLEQKIMQRELREFEKMILSEMRTPCGSLISILDETRDFRINLVTDYRNMESDLRAIQNEEQRNIRMLQFLERITAPEKRAEDKKALRRWMDITAVRERARCALHEQERRCELAIKLLGVVCCDEFNFVARGAGLLSEWQKSGMEERLWLEFDESPRWQNRMSCLKSLARIIEHCDSVDRNRMLGHRWRETLKSVVANGDEVPFIQIEAFRIQLLVNEQTEIGEMIKNRFTSPADNRHDIFTRSGLLSLVFDACNKEMQHRLIDLVVKRPDPSEHVRMHAASLLPKCDWEIVSHLSDALLSPTSPGSTPKVRASAIFSLRDQAFSIIATKISIKRLESIIETLHNQLRMHSDQVTIRAAVDALSDIAVKYAEVNEIEEITDMIHLILKNLDSLISSSKIPEVVKRSASLYREKIIVASSRKLRYLLKTVQLLTDRVDEGGNCVVERNDFEDINDLGRILAIISSEDFGFSVTPLRSGFRIIKGDLYRRRIWRIWNEFTNPDPSKRQGFLHTVGRDPVGVVRVPSRLLAETTATKVPGERVYNHEEASWRPYIPTIDDILSLSAANAKGDKVYIFSLEGMTELKRPKGMLDRLFLWLQTTLEYNELARRRNLSARQIDEMVTRSFVQILVEDFNVEITFKPHSYIFKDRNYSVIDPTVARNLYPIVGSMFYRR